MNDYDEYPEADGSGFPWAVLFATVAACVAVSASITALDFRDQKAEVQRQYDQIVEMHNRNSGSYTTSLRNESNQYTLHMTHLCGEHADIKAMMETLP